ncbi:MAG: hypothetical protein RLZZ319_573 [Actinomycetota bacterium]
MTKRRLADSTTGRLVVGLILPVVLLAWWEIAADLGQLPRYIFPAPSRIFSAAVEGLADGSLVDDIGWTLMRILAGFFLGGTLGYLMGLITGINRTVRALVEPMFSALYTVPKIAVFPVFLGIFGLGESPKIALVAVTVFFYCWVYTFGAVTNIDPSYIDVARTYTTSTLSVIRHVIIPATVPQVFSALRVSIAVATLVTISSEFVVGDTGLGYVIFHSRLLMRIEEAYVGIFLVAILGFVLQRTVIAIGKRIAPWSNLTSTTRPNEIG